MLLFHVQMMLILGAKAIFFAWKNAALPSIPLPA